MSAGTDSPLLEVGDLVVQYPRRRMPPFRALHGVSLSVQHGETVGIVGESGSGKSTLGNAILGMVPVHSGRIGFDGTDITSAPPARRRALSEHLSVIFQDPYSSLNPSRTIGQTLREPLMVHGRPDAVSARERTTNALARVGLGADALDRYPDAFSGGQRQRIAIARALILSPKLVVCDEAVSALDLSVQAQVLNLLRELQDEMSLSYLFISHDLDVVRHVSRRVLVMYRGHVVEEGPASRICRAPSHPYTQGLLAAAPVPDPAEQARRRAERHALRESVASRGPAAEGSGCPYVARCPHAMPVCLERMPRLEPTGSEPAGGRVACHWAAATPSPRP
jgi:peptide/nickel transport system ATP-binding protein